MAKKIQYFSLDTDLFQDIKVRKLIRRQGSKSVGVYLCVLCTIYRDGYYATWDNDLPFIIGEQTGCPEKYVKEVIECCVQLQLLDKGCYEKGVLTSTGIQQRYKNILTSSRRKCDIDEYSLIDKDTPGPAPATPADQPQPKPKPKPSPPPTPAQLDFLCNDMRTKLTIASVEEDDISEALRLMYGETANYVATVIRSWFEKPRMKFYEILQMLQRLEEQGRIKPRYTYHQWQAVHYIQHSKDITDAERITILKEANDAKRLDIITHCVKEINKGKIKLPGKFIIAQLNSSTH